MLFQYIRMFYSEIGARLIVLFFLLLLAAFSEAVSISLILPLLQDPATPNDNFLSTAIGWLTDLIGLPDTTTAILSFMVGMFFIRGAFMIAQSMYQARIISDHLVQIRQTTISALFKSRFTYLSSKETGFLTNAVTAELEKVNFSLRQLGSLAVATTTMLVYVTLTILFQPVIFIFMLALIVPIGLIAAAVNRKTREASVDHSHHAGEQQSLLVEAVLHSKYLMATGRSSAVAERIFSETRRLGHLYRRLMRLGSISQYGFEPFAVLVLAAIVFYYTEILENPISEVVFLVLLFFQGSKSVLGIQPAYRKFVQAAGSLELYQRLNAELEENVQTIRTGAVLPDMSGDIVLSSVSITYPNQEIPSLRDVNLVIPARKTVALVGPSGSGKSTVANVLTGLIEPTTGSVTIGGADYASLDIAALQSNTAYVTQEPAVFRGTVDENVTMWDNDPDVERTHSLLEKVGLAHIADRSKSEHESVLRSGGMDLSGGERQRLAIARELYRPFGLLILDEATSALDSELEGKIDSLLNEELGNKTIVVIAHRLSTIRNADVVHVLENGSVVESGSYDQLVNTDGHFARMVRAQDL